MHATAWRLVLLEGGVASEASYPAWHVAETSRPKVLVFFLRLWRMLSGIWGEPSELPIVFEACGDTSNSPVAVHWDTST